MEITIEAPKVKKEEKTFTKENGLWTIYPYQKQSEIIKSYKDLNVFETAKKDFSEEFVFNSNHVGFGPISFEETKTESLVSKQIVERLHDFGFYPKIEIVKIVNHLFLEGENNASYYFRYQNQLLGLFKAENIKRNFLRKEEITRKTVVAAGGIILDLVNKN